MPLQKKRRFATTCVQEPLLNATGTNEVIFETFASHYTAPGTKPCSMRRLQLEGAQTQHLAQDMLGFLPPKLRRRSTDTVEPCYNAPIPGLGWQSTAGV